MHQPRFIFLGSFLTVLLTIASHDIAQSTSPTRIAVVNLQIVYSNMQETIDCDHVLAGMKDQLAALTKSNGPEEDQQALKIRITRTQNHQLAQAFGKIQQAVAELAKTGGYDLVLVSNGTGIPPDTADIADSKTVANLVFNHAMLFVSPPVDLTAEVITRLNKNPRPAAAALPTLPTTPMQIGSKTFQLEIAADDASRQHGLMERDTLPGDHGMIFVFPDVTERNFWMHHTRFPLDILYANEQGTIVSIKTMKPYDESNVPSDGPAKYAIELPAGQAAITGVKPGDRLNIPPAADAAAKIK